jgi:hypothetical protein
MLSIVIGLFLSLVVQSADAAVIHWTDWKTAASTVKGIMNIDGMAVDVTFSGLYLSAQTASGTNYWNPSAPYISSFVDNVPPATDIIQLYKGGSKTVTFSRSVVDPVMALVSWNGNTVNFGVPIEILSNGRGYFGSGTPVLNAGKTGFYGSGEVHAVLRIPGTFTSITFTDTNESWHGFTVGAAATPEPGTMLLTGMGLAILVSTRTRRSRKMDNRPD